MYSGHDYLHTVSMIMSGNVGRTRVSTTDLVRGFVSVVVKHGVLLLHLILMKIKYDIENIENFI